MMPLAYLLLSDKIRPEAPEVLAYFKEQGVAVKVISGTIPLRYRRSLPVRVSRALTAMSMPERF